MEVLCVKFWVIVKKKKKKKASFGLVPPFLDRVWLPGV